MAVRFAIQCHTMPEGVHFDLLIAAGPRPGSPKRDSSRFGGPLATWRLEKLPTDLAAGESLPATALPDHRAIYLSYEGRVSGGRGSVAPADAGECVILLRTQDLWMVELSGRRVRGRFTLRRLDGTSWSLSAGGDCPTPREA